MASRVSSFHEEGRLRVNANHSRGSVLSRAKDFIKAQDSDHTPGSSRRSSKVGMGEGAFSSLLQSMKEDQEYKDERESEMQKLDFNESHTSSKILKSNRLNHKFRPSVVHKYKASLFEVEKQEIKAGTKGK